MKEHPAIVRESDDLAAIAAEIKAAMKAAKASEADALRHYKAAGKALVRAKKLVGHGHWLAWLEKSKLPEREARRCVAWFKSDKVADLESAYSSPVPEDTSETEEVPAQKLDRQSNGSGQSEKEPDEKDDSEDGIPFEDADKPAVPPSCDRCNLVGYVPGCPLCKAIRDEAAGKPSREPGSDDKPAPKAVKNGQQIIDWKQWHDAFGVLYRSIDAVWIAAGLVRGQAVREDPQHNGLQRLLTQFSGDFKSQVKEKLKIKPPEGGMR